MNVQVIQMDPRIARVHWADYRKSVRRHRAQRELVRIERAAECGKELRQIQIERFGAPRTVSAPLRIIGLG